MTRAFQTKRTPFSKRILMASTALVAAGAMATAPLNAKAENAWVLDQQGGSFDTDTSINNITNITQHTDRAYGVGDLDIQEYQTVNIQQNNSGSLFIARDDKNDPTQILGALNANGQVMIIDRNGVFFGENSRIDVNGIVATTADVNVDAIMNGASTIEFTNLGDATIENRGTITVAEAGIAAFVAPTVKNSGVINAKIARVAFAAGEHVTLDLYGDRLLEIKADSELEDALLENSGTINAQGGVVQMTASAAKDAVDNVINMSGVINASSVSQKGGKIILGGGDSGVVEVSGTLDASGATGGGEIDIVGENTVITETASVSVDATANGNGGETFIWGNNAAILSGSVSARGGATGGNGGKVELSAGNAVGFNGNVDTSAANGETGTFLIDPENINLGDFTGLQTLGDLAADVFAGGSLGELRIDDQALANTLKNTDVNLWASNSIYTSSDFDISTWVELCGPVCQFFGGSTEYGITANDLGLSAPVITFDHNVTLGTGNLILQDTTAGDSFLGFGLIDAPADIEHTTLNLNAQVLTRDTVGGATSVAGDAQVGSVADTINVLSDSALIQQAISFADNPDGALITVAAGTYNESVNVNKHNLTLEGANAGNHGAGLRAVESVVNPNSPGFLVTGNGVTIDGFEIEGGDIGIHVAGADDVTLVNNLIHGQRHPAAQGTNVGAQGTGDGILVNGYADNTNISDNYIYDTDDEGVQVFQATNLTVHNNLIDNSGDGFDSNGDIGIALDSVTGSSSITANYVRSGFDAGIEVKDSSGVTIGGSESDANIVDGYAMGADDKDVGIYVKRSSGIVVSYNEVDGSGAEGIYNNGSNGTDISYNTVMNVGGAGIFVNPSSNVEVTFNEIDNTGSHGIDIYAGTNNTVSNNEIGLNGGDNNINGDGIHVLESNGFTAQSNTITNTTSTAFDIGSGIQVLNSADITIGGEGDLANTIYNTAWDGIRFDMILNGVVEGNDIDDVQRVGIYAKRSENLSILDNNIDGTAEHEGIGVVASVNVDVTGNDITNTADHGIFTAYSSDVDIEENSIFNAGVDGVHGYDMSNLNILGNTIALTRDDGIEVEIADRVHIEGNILGHIGFDAWDADGIRVIDSAHTVIKSNGIADVLDDGIRVDGGNYAGIFDNHVLRVGDEGIEVSNVFFEEDMDVTAAFADIDYPTVGYPVSIEGNEVVLTGDHGIYVHDAGATRIIDNEVSFAGIGQENVYEAVNDVAGDIHDFLNHGPVFDTLLVQEVVEDYDLEFTLLWGNGDGIKVENVFRDEFYPYPTDTISTFAGVDSGDSHSFYYGYDGWDVLIQGNNVAYTGGDGIDVNNAGTTLIGGYEGDENTVYQAGIASTLISGASSFADWTESGPFLDTEARRVVWIDGEWDAEWTSGDYGDLTGALYPYLTESTMSIQHDTHDGIRATNIYNSYYFRPRILEADTIQISESAGNAGLDGGLYGYAVNVIGNDVNTTGDDGIEVGWASSALIKDNTVMGAGIGGYDGSDLVAETKVNYGVGDYNGADGISAHNIYGEGEISKAGSVSTGDYEEYALVIDGNYVNGTADDGIEAVYAGRTLISNNQTYNNGVYGNGYNDVYDDVDQYDYDVYYPGYYGTAGDGYGSDGIHARYIEDHTYSYDFDSSYDEETGYTTYVDTYTYGDDVAVDINNNIVDTTGDDGIEVLSSGRTVIDNNNVTHSGYGGGYYYGAADGWGADGIHVRDVITDGFQETYTEVYGYYGYYGEGYYGYYGEIDSDYSGESLFNNGTSVLITNNYVDVTGDDGIQVLFSGNSVIDSNEVYNAGYGDSIPYEGEGIYDGNGADGIHVQTGFIESYYGYYGGGDAKLALAEVSVADTSDYFLSTSTVITNNIVNTADDDGIDVEGVTDVFIGFNDVDNVNDDGIEVVGYAGGFFDSFEEEIAFGVADVEPTFTVDILANNVNTSGDTGITVEGMDFITVSNNDVLNSDEIGVLIAGPNNGSVILSGNTLTDNDVHARFESGAVDLTGSGNDFNNGRVGIQFDGPLVSLIDDEPTDEFEGTLGSQTFTNQSQFFVELSNGALFEPGQPSIYNALDSSYFFSGDYFSPSDTSGIVSLAQLNFLEDMFYHFNDEDTLGLFFFGALSLENLEDFFNTFGTFDGNVTGASVTITGLPTTSSQQTALLLNNLTPAAGEGEGGIPGDTNGDGELSAEELANLDPAAGSNQVNCWSDAVSGLEGGATVNYSFDTSFESALADTAGCSTNPAQ